MNDFTKEELIEIEDVLSTYYDYWDQFDLEQVEHLKDKVKNMIDNYCEHKEQYEDHDYSPMRCKKFLDIVE